jgi:ABC-type Fe3+ transport system substrate-binding protein
MGFLDSFFSPGSKEIKAGAKAADQFYTQGLSEARPLYQQATGRLDPYAQTGGQANALYAAALGLSGPEAQQGFLANYQADPTQEAQQQAVARAMAARGLLDSGASRLASARVWNEGYQGHLNRLLGASQQGMQAAGQQGQYDVGQGDMIFGTRQLQANNQISKANALAASKQAGLNNLIGLGSLAVSAATGVPMPRTGR